MNSDNENKVEGSRKKIDKIHCHEKMFYFWITDGTNRDLGPVSRKYFGFSSIFLINLVELVGAQYKTIHFFLTGT